MKKIVFSLLVVIAVACNGPSKKEIAQEKDSLVSAAAEQDKIMNELVSSLIAIDENLQEIKKKENLIEVNMGLPEGASQDTKDRINKDIQDIYSLMLANKERIADLEQRINKSGSENKNLSTLVSSLNRQLKEKSIEIIEMNEQLSNKNIQIASLNFSVEGMEHVIDSIRSSNKSTKAVLDSTTLELNTAYYAFGTKKELKEHNVITTDGLPVFGKQKVLSSEFNEDYFTKIDIRNIDSIPLFRPKIKILTNHPEDSYEIITGEEETKSVKILDKEAFWSISKFMVVQVN